MHVSHVSPSCVSRVSHISLSRVSRVSSASIWIGLDIHLFQSRTEKNGFSRVLRVFKRAVDIAIYRCKHGKVTLNVVCFYIVIHSFCHV